MRCVVLAVLAVGLVACDDDGEQAGGPGGCGDVAAQCPLGTSPLAGVQAEASCAQSTGGIVSDGEGQATAQCVGAGSCRVLCQFAVPCRCGVAVAGRDGVVCASCDGAASCGNGLCEGGEDPASCPIDCGAQCEPDERRCDGPVLETCNLQGRWERLPCPAGDVCSAEAGPAACVRDPGIIGGGDAGVGADGGGGPIEGRIVPGEGVFPGVHPAPDGRSPQSRVEERLPFTPAAGAGQAAGSIGGIQAWRLVPGEDLIQLIGSTGAAVVDFSGALLDTPFTADADRFCADYAACFNSPPPADCAAFVAQQLETWSARVLQCVAEQLVAGDPAGCGNLALGGGNCVAAGLGYADGVQLQPPLARRGARVIGFADAAFTVGAMVDLAAGRASRFDRVGELRLRASPTSLSLSADGRTAAYIGFEGADEAIILWDLDANTRRAVLPISVGSTGPIALSADASVLAMRRSGTGDAAVDGTVSVWNLADEQRIFSIVPPDGGSFDLSLELSPDGRTLAVVTRRPNAVELWDVERRALLHTLELARDLEVGTVHFSPDGALVAVTYENFERAATLWQVDGGQRTFTREEAGPPSFSSDGRILIIPLELRAGLGLLRDP